MERLKNNIVIMDFSGIYQEEQFWHDSQVCWMKMQDISGTNCYCDEEAVEEIQKRLENFSHTGIYFIDSGNYHYMSRIGAGRVQKPFRLLVFDNHTDMQLPAFGGLLSCGGWIANALEELEYLEEVWLAGPDDEAYSQVEEQFKSKVKFISREMLHQGNLSEWLEQIPVDLPLYVSIDKDVLCQEDASTTWSQGDMKLAKLLEALEALMIHFSKNNGRIWQVDICGECDPDQEAQNQKNDLANGRMLEFWKKWM